MHDIIMVKAMAAAALVGKVVVPPLTEVTLIAADVITESTGVPLTIVAAVGGACWYLNGRFTKLEDGLNSLRDELSNRPCGVNAACPTKKENVKT